MSASKFVNAGCVNNDRFLDTRYTHAVTCEKLGRFPQFVLKHVEATGWVKPSDIL